MQSLELRFPFLDMQEDFPVKKLGPHWDGNTLSQNPFNLTLRSFSLGVKLKSHCRGFCPLEKAKCVEVSCIIPQTGIHQRGQRPFRIPTPPPFAQPGSSDTWITAVDS